MLNAPVRLVRCPRCRKLLQEPLEVLVYECGGCGTKLQVKKRRNDIVDTTSQKPEDDSSGKQIMKQLSNDHEASSSSNNQQLVVNSINEQNRNSDHNDLPSSNIDQDAVKKAENDSFNASSDEVCSSSNKRSPVNSIVGTDRNIEHNDPRSSTELSGNEDPESSPEATAYNRVVRKEKENVTVDFDHSSEKQKLKQLSDDHETGDTSDQQSLVKLTNESDKNIDQDNEQEFKSCRNMDLTSSSFSELEEPLREANFNRKIVRDFASGSKSSFKSLIAEKLLDTRQKKVMYVDEDDMLSEDGTADLSHRRRFDRISSENVQFGGASNYYGYEGSVSSFDGNEDKVSRKNRNGSKGDEYVVSGNMHRFNRRTEFHPWNEHQSNDVRSSYGLNESHVNPRYHSSTIHENPKMERIELLKMVRQLQDQLEKTSISNPAQQVPGYYDHGLNYPGRYGHRMAFSGETTAVNRQLDRNACHQCCPQDRHFSAQLPRQHVCCNGPHYGPNDYYSPRYSVPSSGNHHTESEFSVPDDHRHKYEVTKPYRSPKKKRYVRPIAGGSPWITCYWCSELLELPQSFLVFKKRYHSLRCGACSKVLNFTLCNGTHVSRYYPEETIAAPPSSEVEDYDKSIGSRADPVSCTDRSFQRDYSTETDRYGSREFSEERMKAAMSRDPSASTQESSSKISGRRNTMSEIEEVKRGTHASPLHRLMGYASPSKVIRG
ncbi:uncharacterized protein [Rutidosis leptorrhynchoides]|uniref:uncharacterized protein n=1 Tax=Rutidosis leptorrhynchoides TaxID=125765 RepID=UPI003A992FE0